MKNMQTIEVEANTVKDAIEKAAKLLCTKKQNLIIKVLSEGEMGLFNMEGAKPARIRATLKKHTK